jgi:hypothetical protein
LASKSQLFGYLNRIYQAEEASSNDSDQIRLNCPYCPSKAGKVDSSHKLYMHLGYQKFFCQRCNETGTIRKFLKDHMQDQYEDFENYLEAADNHYSSHKAFYRDILSGMYRDKSTWKPKFVKLPKEYKPITPDDRTRENQMALQYLLGRGLTMDKIYLYQMGYCATGYYKGRIIIPITEYGKIVYFTNRLYMWGDFLLTPELEMQLKGQKYEKTLNMSKSDKKGNEYIGKSDVVFNLDLARGFDTAFIVEGAFDVFNMGINSLGILGSYLSRVQKEKILQAGFKSVFVMLDPDAWAKAQKAAEGLSSGTKVFLIKLDEKDPGELTHEEKVYYINKAKRYSRNYFDLEMI